MKYKITLNNKVYEVEVEQGEAIMVDVSDAAAPPAPAAAVPAAAAAPAPSAPAAVTGEGAVIPSPLPGTIVTVRVAPGDNVKKGQSLAVIEAMKMENEVPSPRDGVVTQILAPKGTVVQTGAPLLMMK